MFVATLICLAVAACIFAGLLCCSFATFLKTASIQQTSSWNAIKAACIGLCSQYDQRETPRQKALRSWAGTLVICAGLCMVGLVMEAKCNRLITIKSVVSGIVCEPTVSAQAYAPIGHHKQAYRSNKQKNSTPPNAVSSAKTVTQQASAN